MINDRAIDFDPLGAIWERLGPIWADRGLIASSWANWDLIGPNETNLDRFWADWGLIESSEANWDVIEPIETNLTDLDRVRLTETDLF